MFNAAAADAHYHCTHIRKTLTQSKVTGLTDIPLPEFSKDENTELSIPSISFVVTKILKTFDVKLAKGGRAFNASHCHDWIREIHDIERKLSSGPNRGGAQYLLRQTEIPELSQSDVTYLNRFAMDTPDSDSNDDSPSADANTSTQPSVSVNNNERTVEDHATEVQ